MKEDSTMLEDRQIIAKESLKGNWKGIWVW